MTATTTFPIESESQWHALRAQDITSTQVAALFDCNPYLTHFELWHQKRDGIVETVEQTDRMAWGNRLERTIAEGFAEEHGLHRPRKLAIYSRIEGERIGASFDYVADAPVGLPQMSKTPELPVWDSPRVLIECKNVDGYEFAEKWTETEAPPHIELQVATQMLVSGIGRAFIVALVGGNRLAVYERELEAVVAAKIIDKVRAFWRSIEAGTPPTPDYVRDADYLLANIYNRTEGREIEADATVQELLGQWLGAKAMAENVRPLQARIAELIGTASKVRTPHGLLSCAANKNGVRSFRYYPNKEIAR